MIDELQALLNSVPQEPSSVFTYLFILVASIAGTVLVLCGAGFLVASLGQRKVINKPTRPRRLTPKERLTLILASGTALFLLLLTVLIAPAALSEEKSQQQRYDAALHEHHQKVRELLLSGINKAQPDIMTIELIDPPTETRTLLTAPLPEATPKGIERFIIKLGGGGQYSDPGVMVPWANRLVHDGRPHVKITYTSGQQAVFEATHTSTGDLALVTPLP
ncbi:hypothetical protein ANMWB30_23980 [Arthrobacter sp. MWB30]|nr:hypothetical protein ANMWB30_23980 [Arthrobacter sp. MWB30]